MQQNKFWVLLRYLAILSAGSIFVWSQNIYTCMGDKLPLNISIFPHYLTI